MDCVCVDPSLDSMWVMQADASTEPGEAAQMRAVACVCVCVSGLPSPQVWMMQAHHRSEVRRVQAGMSVARRSRPVQACTMKEGHMLANEGNPASMQ